MGDEMVAFGKFRIVSRTYTKGDWVVFDAVEIALERPLHLRLYSPPLPKKSEEEQRFVLRLREISALDHPNVQGVLDFGIIMEKGYYTTSPRLSRSLQEMFAERLLDVLDEEERLKASIELVKALRSIHETGHPHGAISLDTLFWDRKRDFPYFAWFPILTGSGEEFDEPLRPIPPGYADQQEDVYRLAGVIHRFLTGTSPLTDLEGAPETAAVNVPGTTEGVHEVLSRALHREPARAYDGADELLVDLEKTLSKQKVRWELEKSVSSLVVPQEMLEAALTRKREQKRKRRQKDGVSAAELPYVSPFESLPGGPKLVGAVGAFLLMISLYPFLGSSAPAPAPRPRPATTTRAPPTSLREPERPTRRPTSRPTRRPRRRAGPMRVEGGLKALEDASPTDETNFLPRWGTLKSWILSLPPAKRRNLFTYGTLVQLRSEYKRDQSAACRKLDGLIRQAVNEAM